MKASFVELVDILLYLLITGGSPRWDLVGGFGPVITASSSIFEGEEESYNSGFRQTHVHPSNNHHHPHPFALPLWLSSTRISSTNPPVLGASSWLRYTSNGNPDTDKDANNKNYNSNNGGDDREDSANNFRNNYDNDNSSLSLMSGFTLTSNGNESANDSFGDGPRSNDTEIGDEEEGSVFEAEIPWWRQMIWSILFGAMVVVACTGNVTVIWIGTARFNPI